jgi:hypothetical protein
MRCEFVVRIAGGVFKNWFVIACVAVLSLHSQFGSAWLPTPNTCACPWFSFACFYDRWCKRYYYYAVCVYNTEGMGNRVRLPICVVTAIRTKFPNPAGVPYGDEEYHL